MPNSIRIRRRLGCLEKFRRIGQGDGGIRLIRALPVSFRY